MNDTKTNITTKELHEQNPDWHQKGHKSHRAAWLRAAVLGADDGIVSTASLMLGVAAAHSSRQAVLTAGLAGLIAGALSMAAGEYVSVSSQRDSERADLVLEDYELRTYAKEELQELTNIYIDRGLDAALALQVAQQLHDHDALAAHARDELGIDHESLAKPFQAAFSSAASFTAGALLPLLAALIFHDTLASWAIAIVSITALATLGATGAVVGGGSRSRAALRVFVGGGLAMLVTTLIGRLIGAAV